MSQKRVVVVGGGFGGIAAARGLAKAPVDVTVIDKRNHHLFQPLLYQVATAGLNPSDIAYPIRTMLSSQENVDVILGEVGEVRSATSEVELVDGAVIEYDYLVLAPGSSHSYFGNNHWEEFAPGLKTVEDALEIRRRVLLAFERADRATDPAERQANLRFIVVGGGPTGVEMAGAIAEIAFKTLCAEFRNISSSNAEIILLEGSGRVLGPYSEELSAKAQEQLVELGVDVRTGTMVTDISADAVVTSTGTIETKTVIWGAGVAASPLMTQVGAEHDRAGRVIVEADLSVPGQANIFVVGDASHSQGKAGQVPGVAQGAIQGGTHAANSIKADFDGRPRKPFKYKNKGELATIGRSAAVGAVGPFKLTGWMAWMAWWAVHVFFLIDFRSRAVVLFSWGWSYATFQRGARLITSAWKPGYGRSPGSGS